MELKNNVAIVTGSGSGIGRAIALELAQHGMRVVCVGRRKQRLDETVGLIEQAGAQGLAIAADVTDAAQVRSMVEGVLARFGQIDVLFNNAGSFNTIGGLWEIDPVAWWNDVTINLRGPMLTSHFVLPHLMSRNRGVILNMNGGGSTVPLAGGSAYGSSKAALLRLTDTLAAELKRAGSDVIVCAMGPGFVRTEMTELQTSEAGQRWIPGSKSALEAGKDRSPADAARATVRLLQHLHPAFAGRIFGPDDDFAALAASADDLVANDRRTLRHRG